MSKLVEFPINANNKVEFGDAQEPVWYDLEELKKHHINHYAQAGEDGLLEYIFENIIPKTYFAVEFGAGYVSKGMGTPNVRWLVEEFGWKCVMWEIVKKKITKKYVHEEAVTHENVNDLFEKYKVPRDVDIVVIDVDGQDYWIWESLEWKPQVVEIEFNTALDFHESKVMKKDSEHYTIRDTSSGNYGASVLALKKLGTKKGYTMIGRCGRNLFFVLNELVEGGYDVDIDDLDLEVCSVDKNRKVDKENENWIEV